MPMGYAKQGTPGHRKRVARLLKVVRAEVGPLLPAERLLVRAAALGEFCRVPKRTGDAPFDSHEKEEKWKEWDEHRVVRAAVLRTLCVRKAAHKHVDPLGVRLAGARVTGTLELDGATVPYDIDLHACGIERPIDAYSARLAGLNLEGSRVPGLHADRLSCRGSVFLRGGFHATGVVRLVGAQLGGNLDCNGGRFEHPGGVALVADGLSCRGGVFLSGGFHATGGVRLAGAQLGGDLACDGGRFEHPGGVALSADGLSCRGGVFLRGGFHAMGGVRLVGAQLGGDLSCVGGRFEHPGGDALNGDGADVAGTVFLWSAAFDGRLNLTRSRVGYLNDHPLLYLLDRTPAWPERILLNDWRYDAIHTQSPLDAASRLAWLANHDRTMEYLPPSGWPGTITAVRRVVLRLLPGARAGYWSKAARPCDPQPYRHLASVLRKQGHEGDASTVLTALGWRRLAPLFRQRWRGSGWDRVKAVVLGIFAVLYGAIVGHGYARFRPLYWILVFWAIGSAVFWQGGGRVMQPTQAVPLRAWTKAEAQGFAGTPMQPAELAAWARVHGERIADEDVAWANAYPRFNPVVYALDALLPLVDFHQEEYWTPRNGPGWVRPWPSHRVELAWWKRLRFPSGQWWIKAFYLPLHIAMGWIVATLFAASFTRLARRE